MVRTIKENIYKNFDEKLNKAEDDPQKKIEYELPDGQVIHFEPSKIKYSSLLFGKDKVDIGDSDC